MGETGVGKVGHTFKELETCDLSIFLLVLTLRLKDVNVTF